MKGGGVSVMKIALVRNLSLVLVIISGLSIVFHPLISLSTGELKSRFLKSSS